VNSNVVSGYQQCIVFKVFIGAVSVETLLQCYSACTASDACLTVKQNVHDCYYGIGDASIVSALRRAANRRTKGRDRGKILCPC
jgi:hypothetical protein